jgi:ribonuclease HII
MTKKSKKQAWIVGIDEVGRGPLAGPVTVCAVATPYASYKKARWAGLTDSKQLSPKQREVWHAKARALEQEGTITIALVSQTAAQIDRKGISSCIRACIAKSLEILNLDPTKTKVLLDGGLKAPLEYVDQTTVIKGDQKHKIISLASVIAKVTRDAYMAKMDATYPGYGWARNKGYGTASHYKALKKLYITRLHRKSFLKGILDI